MITEPILIEKPYVVPLAACGPLLYPLTTPSRFQPVWGNGARLFQGLQDRFKTTDTYRPVRKPGKRIVGEQVFVEPDGGQGTSYEAYLDHLRDAFRTGWTPAVALERLESGAFNEETGELVGPSAQHRWQQVRHGWRTDWFLELWNDIAMTETRKDFRAQVDRFLAVRGVARTTPTPPGVSPSPQPSEGDEVNMENRTTRQVLFSIFIGPEGSRLLEGTALGESQAYRRIPAATAKPFAYSEERLESLRRWLLSCPGLHRRQIEDQCFVVNRRVLRSYLVELQRQGRATATTVKTGKPGKPPQVWTAVRTAADDAWDAEQAAEQQHARAFDLEGLITSIEEAAA